MSCFYFQDKRMLSFDKNLLSIYLQQNKTNWRDETKKNHIYQSGGKIKFWRRRKKEWKALEPKNTSLRVKATERSVMAVACHFAITYRGTCWICPPTLYCICPLSRTLFYHVHFNFNMSQHVSPSIPRIGCEKHAVLLWSATQLRCVLAALSELSVMMYSKAAGEEARKKKSLLLQCKMCKLSDAVACW